METTHRKHNVKSMWSLYHLSWSILMWIGCHVFHVNCHDKSNVLVIYIMCIKHLNRYGNHKTDFLWVSLNPLFCRIKQSNFCKIYQTNLQQPFGQGGLLFCLLFFRTRRETCRIMQLLLLGRVLLSQNTTFISQKWCYHSLI